MTPERWQQIRDLLHSAVQLDVAERPAFLDQHCSNDPALRQELDKLLAVEGELDSSFLESSAVEQLASHLSSSPSSNRLATGTTLGRYEILGLIGAGGMGEVYRARDTQLPRTVAIKVLPADLSSDPVRRQRFEREAHAISTLQHPNICTLHDVGSQEGTDFLVMEYLEGETLAACLQKRALSLDQTLRYGTEVADALDAAHRRGIVHRDLKPGNIFLTTHGEAKVLDFGLAKLGEDPPSADTPTVTADELKVLTTPGVAMGTAAYMSPEQARGEELDARSDVFSLGAVLYEMATGRMAFPGRTSALVFKAILDETPPALTQVKPSLPEQLDEIVGKALEKDRDLRYQSAADLRTDLKRLRRDSTSGVVVTKGAGAPTGSAELQQGAWSRKKWLALSVAVLVLVAIAGLRNYSLRRPSPASPFEAFTVMQLTDTGKYQQVAISPDGKYVLSVVKESGKQSVWLKHIPTNSTTQVMAAGSREYLAPSFSADGNYLYFLSNDPDPNALPAIVRTPVFGGVPQVVARNVASNVAFSPDKEHIAFVRCDFSHRKCQIVLTKVDGTSETLLKGGSFEGAMFLALTQGASDSGFPHAQWSPDGKYLAVPVFGYAPASILLIEISSGQNKSIAPTNERTYSALAWSPDGHGLFVLYQTFLGANGQIGYVSFPTGEFRKLTNDTNSYVGLSLSADGKTIATVQTKVVRSFYLIPSSGTSDRSPVPTFQQDKNYRSPTFARDGEMYVAGVGKLMRMRFDGSQIAELVSDPGSNFMMPSACWDSNARTTVRLPDPRYVVYARSGTRSDEIWRSGPDGSNPIRLSSGKRDETPQCSPDGNDVFYADFDTDEVKRVPVQGGIPEVIPGSKVGNGTIMLGSIAVSPNGKMMARLCSAQEGGIARTKIALFPLGVGINPPVRLLDTILPGTENSNELYFTADGHALLYEVTKDGAENIWMHPLDGRAGHLITNFSTEEAAGFRLSPNGKNILLARRHNDSDIVLLRDTGRAQQ